MKTMNNEHPALNCTPTPPSVKKKIKNNGRPIGGYVDLRIERPALLVR